MSKFSGKEAVEVFSGLVATSKECLRELRIPIEPVGKWREWKVAGGPIGLGIHYTGGADSILSMRWFNDPSRANKGSSVHCIVLDRPLKQIQEIWDKSESAAIFKVPTILLFDFTKAAWHINWANNRLFGIENRNCGYWGYHKVPGGLAALDKQGFAVDSRVYEEFTREQIEANITLGRLWRAVRGQQFRPEWICGHSQIWASKADPGPAFPSMHDMRSAIFSDQPYDQFEWLDGYSHHSAYKPDIYAEDEAFHLSALDADRSDPEKLECPWDAEKITVAVPNIEDMPFVASALYKLGWPCWPGEISPDELKPYIVNFQRSTLALSSSLKVDGIAGPKTQEALKARLKSLCLG